MHILVTGSTGLIGSHLIPFLGSRGHRLSTLVRHEPSHPTQIAWSPPRKGPSSESLEGVDAVIHLAGESIASGRWTEKRKRAIRESRVIGTRLLSQALLSMKRAPKVFICASAIGYYGNRGTEILKEESAPGTGFLADVCKAWEEETVPVSQKGIRVVNLRFGIILTPQGGALGKMLLPFKMGVGGKLGSGEQFMSWIALDEILEIISFALAADALRGPVNAVAPNPVTNAEFTKALGRVLRRPTIFPMPAFAARLAFGEMADALLLSGARVVPAALKEAGYPFQWPELEKTLQELLTP